MLPVKGNERLSRSKDDHHEVDVEAALRKVKSEDQELYYRSLRASKKSNGLMSERDVEEFKELNSLPLDQHRDMLRQILNREGM